MHYQNIIWDWNGTLLNDSDACIKAMNILLKDRQLAPLTDEKYKEVFTFPVKAYYEKIGFDFSKEKFDVPALEFIQLYHQFLPSVQLFPEVKTILHYFMGKNVQQFILSAMEQKSLLSAIENLRIESYFKDIVGINDHFARSKTEQGMLLIKSNKLVTGKTLMIGDTLHDVEVAESIGIDCVLVSQGHQSKKRLSVNGNKVINNLLELKYML